MDKKYEKFETYLNIDDGREFDDAQLGEMMSARDEILDLSQKEFNSEPGLKAALISMEKTLVKCGKLGADEVTFLDGEGK